MKKKITILVVDDSRLTLRLLAKSLNESQTYDFRVLESQSGKLALELAKIESPALILSDLNMPEMTGLELFKAVRSTGYKSPFGLCTANVTEAMQTLFRESGVDFFLAKPFQAKDLLAKVEGAIEHAAASGPKSIFADPATLMDAMIAGLKKVTQTTLSMSVNAAGPLETYGARDIICGSCIRIDSGASALSLGVFSDEATARRLARILFDLKEESDVGKDEIKDMLGEIANMVMSSVLEQDRASSDGTEARLDLQAGLPTFLLGKECSDYLGEANVRASQRMTSEGVDLKLTLVEEK